LVVCLGVDLYVLSDNIGTQSRSQVWRLSSNCVKAFMRIGIPVLFTPEPDIERDSDDKRHDKSIATVERLDCPKAIFQVVSSGGIEENAVKFKPESAKCEG
jgi:hypothetical protein